MKKNRMMVVLGLLGIIVFFISGTSLGSGNEVSMAIDFDMTQIDPATLRTSTDRVLVINVYNGLLQFKPESCEIVEDLAESYEVSPDAKAFTFKLRKGVKFHKGYGELTSSDVKFSIMRHLDPQVKSRQFKNFSVVSTALLTSVNSRLAPLSSSGSMSLSRIFLAFLFVLFAAK